MRISHPDRVIDKATGTRKIDLVQYYESVADWMLPHLKDRPVSLVRAPEDIGGELFFQKHSQKLSIPNVTQHPGLDPGHPPLITIESLKALVGAAQMGTIELHTWNALASNIEKPDRMVFDLDPDTALGWDRMIEAAQLTRTLLEELGLDVVLQDERRQGAACRRAAREAGRLGRSEGVFAGRRAAYGDHAAQALRREDGPAESQAQDLRRLPAQQPRLEHGGRVFRARAAGPGRVGAARVGRGRRVRRAAINGPSPMCTNGSRRCSEDPWADYAKTRQRITAAMKKRLDGADVIESTPVSRASTKCMYGIKHACKRRTQ